MEAKACSALHFGPIYRDMDANKIEKKFPVFRVLVMGRANAGKTTLLERVCDTTDAPEIYDANGHKLDRSTLAASQTVAFARSSKSCLTRLQRGYHDIDNELMFRSNPRFRFHDSRGFEAGGRDEMGWVKQFIANRIARRKTREQLHAIWYCIPVDDNRLVTAAENFFFAECETRDVPVIVAFTKFDALTDGAWGALRKEGCTKDEAEKGALKRAISDFEKEQLALIYDMPHPPRGHVYMQEMDKPGADCGPLMKRTAAALNSETLQQLLVSTQRNSLELCASYALK